MALAICTCALLASANAVAQPDASTDGSYVAPSAIDEGKSGADAGNSSDAHGNKGDEGRTGRDAAASDAGPSGAEGASGQNPPEDEEPPPLTGQSAPSP
jgi:hypothetical protein